MKKVALLLAALMAVSAPSAAFAAKAKGKKVVAVQAADPNEPGRRLVWNAVTHMVLPVYWVTRGVK